MCFYDCYKFECGDYKWGNFRQHCNKEYRMGETCGMKLPLDTYPTPQKCRTCEKYHTKLRKRENELARIKRWTAEGKNPASVEKSEQAVKALDVEIYNLYQEICSRRQNLGGSRPNPQTYNSYSQAQY